MTLDARTRVTLIWLAFAIAAAFIIARAEYRADISAFLPRTPTANQELLVDQLKDGVVSRLMLIGIDGADAPVLAALSKRLAATLRADPQWQGVFNGEAVGVERDGKFLLEHRYALADIAAETWTPAGLRNVMEGARQTIAQNAGLFAKELIPRDPTGEVMRALDELAARNPAPQVGGVWVNSQANEKPRAVLMAKTQAAGVDLDGQARAVAAVNAAFAQAKQSTPGATNATLELAGPGVFSALSRDRIKGDATRFSAIATGLVVVLIWWVYRSPRVMVLGLLPVASGVAAGIAAVALVFGDVHGITLGFGATLIGEAIDYAVYLFTLIRRQGVGVAGQDAHTTMRFIWPTLRLGVWISICGFAAMLFSDFPGLQQLGVFSVAGLIVAVLVTRWVLPHWLPPDFEIRPTTLGDRIARVSRLAPRLRWPLLVVLAALLALGVFARDQVWRDDLANLSPISLAEQRRDESLRNALGAPDVRYLVVAESPELETTLAAADRATAVLRPLQERGVLRAFDSPTRFLPSAATQRDRLQKLPARADVEAPLMEAAAAVGFSANAFAPFLDDLARAKASTPITRQSLDGTQLASQVDALLVQKPGRVTAMLPLQGVQDETAVATAVAALGLPAVRLLDMKTETNSLYQRYRHQALGFALAGVAAIVVLLAFSLRSLTRACRLMFPLLGAVLATASILIALGVSLSIFHLVAFLLVVGVGSNYALFFDRQWERDEPMAPVMLSLVVCNLSTIFGFGVLAFSSMPVLQAIGGTVAIGAFLSLVLSAVYIQPAQSPRAVASAHAPREP
jgi:predicted exporter